MPSTRYCSQILMKFEFYLQILEKLKKQISRKSVQWEQSCCTRADRQTHLHDEPNSRFQQFCERA